MTFLATHSEIAAAGAERGFFASASHEEALARLDYLLDAQRRVGVLVGARGSGKTVLLRRVAQQARRANHGVAFACSAAIELDAWLARLAADWGNGAPSDASRARLWQAVIDALTVHRCEQRASLLLVDNAGQATFEILDGLARLAEVGDVAQPRLTIVLAVDIARVTHLGGELLERAALRIDVAPLEPDEAQSFLESRLATADSSATFAPLAAQRLHALAAGLPRRLNQLTELVLLAAKAENLDEIDAATVDAVYRELSAHSMARRP